MGFAGERESFNKVDGHCCWWLFAGGFDFRLQ